MASHVSSTMISQFTKRIALEYYTFTLCLSTTGKLNLIEYSSQKQDFISKELNMLKNITLFDCGLDHIVCLDDSNCVFSMGGNDCGQLGNKMESFVSTEKPQQVELPPIRYISCGNYFTICVSTEGEVYSFGNGRNGKLGLGNLQKYCSPQKIEILKNVNFVKCGSDFSICITDEDEMFCWGNNSQGQLGITQGDIVLIPTKCVNKPDNIVDVKCGDRHTLVLTLDMEVYSCGSNADGQLGRKTDDDCSNVLEKIDELSEIMRIECGNNHSICIDLQNQLFTFGSNIFGQLGLGNRTDRPTPSQCSSLSNIIDVSSEGFRTFVKTMENEIFIFGKTDDKTGPLFTSPTRVLQNNEDIWSSNIGKSKAKSARK